VNLQLEGKQLQETVRASRNVRGSGIAVDVVGGGLCYHKIHGIEKVLEKKLEMHVATFCRMWLVALLAGA